jgi:hypothetical protein
VRGSGRSESRGWIHGRGESYNVRMNPPVKEALELVLKDMPEDRVQQVLDFARFLAFRNEEAEWRGFGLHQLAKAYGPDEPDYFLP